MTDSDDVTLDRANRISYLVSVGVDSDVIDAAIKRSTDAYDLGQVLGLIEDLIEMGYTINGPQK